MRASELKLFVKDVNKDDVEVLSLNVTDASETDPFILKASDGLDADEIDPLYYGRTSTKSLETPFDFFRPTLLNRTVVLRMGLNPNFSAGERPGDLRDIIYRAISSNRASEVEVRIYDNDFAWGKLVGRITKVEAPLGTQSPETQITISCRKEKMVRGVWRKIVDPTSLAKAPLIISDNMSTAPHGFSVQFIFSADTQEFVISNKARYPDWEFRLVPEYLPDGQFGFKTGDRVTVDSENQTAQLFRPYTGGAYIWGLADRIVPGSIWPVMFPGTNQYYPDDGNNQANWYYGSFNYVESYWGI